VAILLNSGTLLRSAQALEQTDELARENNARVAAAEEAARVAAANAERMAGQIAENTALANEARAKAEAAPAQADAAYKAAALANNRINGLDDYEAVRIEPNGTLQAAHDSAAFDHRPATVARMVKNLAEIRKNRLASIDNLPSLRRAAQQSPPRSRAL